MIDGELIEGMRLAALSKALRPDYEYFLRRIFRRYSEKYHTPLHEVQKLPLLYVMQNFYEGYFEGLSEEDLHEVAEEATTTEEERKQAEIKEKEADDTFMADLVKREMAKEAKRGGVGLLKSAIQQVAEAVEKSREEPEVEPGLGADSGEFSMDFTGEDFESRDSLGIPKQTSNKR